MRVNEPQGGVVLVALLTILSTTDCVVFTHIKAHC